jgi:ATP-dependent helicase/nuclease subunit A
MEARTVFLVDSGSAPFADAHLPRLIPLALKEKPVKGFLWRAGADLANSISKAICNELKVKGEEEYRRLLYVGMTRAEDHLIVCGYHGKRTPMPGTWHSIVKAALRDTPYSEIRSDPEIGEEAIFYRVTGAKQPDRAATEAAAPASLAAVPPMLRRNPPPAERLPRPLTPSGASVLIDEGKEIVISGRSPVLDPDLGPAFAAARGIAVHRLLQVLPSMPLSDRPVAAARYVERVGGDWSPEDRQAVLDSVSRVLADAAFAPVFAEGSRAEVELMGTLRVKDVERAVSGKIDRLAVTPERVLLADFKTNRPPPLRLEDVPPAYLLQLALYRALLQKIYPDRPVEAALVFTEAPLLLPLPAEALAAALARLTRA